MKIRYQNSLKSLNRGETSDVWFMPDGRYKPKRDVIPTAGFLVNRKPEYMRIKKLFITESGSFEDPLKCTSGELPEKAPIKSLAIFRLCTHSFAAFVTTSAAQIAQRLRMIPVLRHS